MAPARSRRPVAVGWTISPAEPALSRPWTAVGDWIEARALFIVAVCAVIGLTLAGIPSHLAQDGWLALVAGRDVAAHGVPHRDVFTVMAHGARWVDQQWLAQLALYELVHLGGLQLMTVAYVLIIGAAFALAVAAARDLGAEDLHVLVVLPAGAFFYLMTAVSIRTQGLAYPLFVATVWLLAAEARSPGRSARVYWVLPMLVLWGNLHGSVTLGAGLATLYGLIALLGGVASSGRAGLRSARAWAFTLLPALTPLATPYGTGILRYYRATLLNSQFSQVVTEWRPLSSVPILAVTLGLTAAAGACVLAAPLARARGRSPRRTPAGERRRYPLSATPAFDVLALAALTAAAVLAVRNVTWFGLALMVLLPSAVTRLRGGPAPLRRARVNRRLALLVAGLTAVGAVAALSQPDAWFTRTYPTGAVSTLKRLVAADPRARIFADVRYGDWLVWQDPGTFSGRIAYDTSFELLSHRQLAMIADPTASSQAGVLDRYAIWVLYPSNHAENRRLLRRAGVRTVLRDRRIIVATYSGARGARRGPR